MLNESVWIVGAIGNSDFVKGELTGIEAEDKIMAGVGELRLKGAI